LKRTDGTIAGEIRSAAELSLGSGPRVFAIGIIRAEAEVGGEPFAYAAGSATGTAQLLPTPPSF
jgi:hypothetical protein